MLNTNIIGMSLPELQIYRDQLVAKYIGEFNKPIGYFDKLTDVDILIRAKS